MATSFDHTSLLSHFITDPQLTDYLL